MPIDPSIQEQLLQRLFAVVASGILAWVFIYVAAKRHFFQIASNSLVTTKQLKLWECIGAFLVFLIMTLIVMPGGFYLIYKMINGSDRYFDLESLSPTLQGWYSIAVLSGSSLGLVTYCLCLSKNSRQTIFGPSTHYLNAFFKGMVLWVISFPLVIFITQVIELVIVDIAKIPTEDQVAVRYVKMVVNDPLLFTILAFSVIVVAPIAEEILFRGFLQSWLRQKMSRYSAISISGLLFAACHLSLSQGWSNVELMVALFALACFLGFIFEKEKSLWAPIGLHMTFNAISIVGILIKEVV